MPTDQPKNPEPAPLVAAAHQFARDLIDLGLSVDDVGDIMDDAGPEMLKAAAAEGVRVTADDAAQMLGCRLGDTPPPGSWLDRFIRATTDAEREAILREAFPPPARNEMAD